MRQWTRKEYCKMLEKNGYSCTRNGKGSHLIYTNILGNHISIGKTINPCIAQRLIRENGLNIVFLIYGNFIDVE